MSIQTGLGTFLSPNPRVTISLICHVLLVESGNLLEVHRHHNVARGASVEFAQHLVQKPLQNIEVSARPLPIQEKSSFIHRPHSIVLIYL